MPVDCESCVLLMNDVAKASARRSASDLLLVGSGHAVLVVYIYDKDEMPDLTKAQRETLSEMLKDKLKERRK